MSDINENSCQIRSVPKQRDGRNRFWCRTHQSPARSVNGSPPTVCENPIPYPITEKTVEVSVADFPGQLSCWGALEPAIDTGGPADPTGVHLHARSTADGGKNIDGTFDRVFFNVGSDLFDKILIPVDSKDAVAYFLSSTAGISLRTIRCSHCNNLHTDSNEFAVYLHKKHLCHHCGREFSDTEPSVGNAVMGISQALALPERTTIRSPKSINVTKEKYPGGFQIWASNPALIWLSDRSEMTGIHLHAFDESGRFLEDETFGELSIEGIPVDDAQCRAFMAQRFVDPQLEDVSVIKCPSCGTPQFDEGLEAFHPVKERHCNQCNQIFQNSGKQKRWISNPFIEVRERIILMWEKI